MAVDKKGREYDPLNVRIYADEDPDLIEYLKGKPKTWLVKEALRHYRDTHGLPTQSHQTNSKDNDDDDRADGRSLLGSM